MEAQHGANAGGGSGRGLRLRRKRDELNGLPWEAVFSISNRQSRPSRYQTRLNRLRLHGDFMRTFNTHEAKTHLSRLVDEAEKGEPRKRSFAQRDRETWSL